MANFPSSLPSIPSSNPGDTLSVAGSIGHTALHNLIDGEILAIATKIGTGAATPVASTVLRGTGAGTSNWDQVALATDVKGTLPPQNGGTGQNSLTGLVLPSPVISGTVSGGATYSSPILTTPTIASFVNATHNHQSAAGGGTLNGANAILPGTVNYANLLSGIFSGQVQSQANAGSGGGTIFYINLGGILMSWGRTSGLSGTGDFVITQPSPFYTTVQFSIAIPSGGYTNTNQITCNIAGSTTASLTVTPIVVAGASPVNAYYWFTLGT